MTTTYTKLADLLVLGGEQLGQMALAGELRMEHLWTAAEGAEKYRAAVRAGDIAGNQEAAQRAATCRLCPSRSWTQSKLAGVKLGWCGKRLEERLNVDPPTCGCFTLIAVEGEVLPGAKLMVGSERCPQGRF